MKAQDLRIGNIIQGQGPQTVKSISEYGEADGYRYLITVEENRNQYKEIEVAGIPLSPEWLERAGFEAIDDDGLWEHPETREFQIQEMYLTGGHAHIWDAAFTDAPMLYVHQLQNLYFALCGQELTFTQND